MGLTLSKMCHLIPCKGSDKGNRSGFITDKSSGLLTPLGVTPSCLGGYCEDYKTNSKNAMLCVYMCVRREGGDRSRASHLLSDWAKNKTKKNTPHDLNDVA